MAPLRGGSGQVCCGNLVFTFLQIPDLPCAQQVVEGIEALEAKLSPDFAIFSRGFQELQEGGLQSVVFVCQIGFSKRGNYHRITYAASWRSTVALDVYGAIAMVLATAPDGFASLMGDAQVRT